MKILAIETSCDETGLCLMEASGGPKDPQFKALSEALISQIEIHKQYGGVFPMLAKREHAANLIPLLAELLKKVKTIPQKPLNPAEKSSIEQILEREPELQTSFIKEIANLGKPDIDLIAVTQGPGLEPALWVGINFAKALSIAWQTPILPVNHMEGHIFSVLAGDKAFNFEFPILGLLVSGGHTELVLQENWLQYKLLGDTLDDAAGEAFDKAARILGLPYPGGPEISKLAAEARQNNYEKVLELPRPMLKSGDFRFSFSGLKTAVLYGTKKLGELSAKDKASIAREFEDSVIDVLFGKTLKAVEEFGPKAVIVAGGVSANASLRARFQLLEQSHPELRVLFPDRNLSTDNAVMIATAAYIRSIFSPDLPPNGADLKAAGNLKLA